MANQEYLEILGKGVDVWNKWRSENPDEEIIFDRVELSGVNLAKINLSKVYLAESNLRGIDLSEAWLGGINLGGSKLMQANLRKAHLNGAYLGAADLTAADLSEADINRSNLRGANFSKARLFRANLFEAKLNLADFPEANLNWADLRNASLTEATLRNANLAKAIIGSTILADIDLSNAIGLDSVRHSNASTLGTNTLVRSKGAISKEFLRGCGLSDWEIEAARLYNPNLSNQEMDEILYRVHDIRAHQPVQISPLFISYSHADSEFVDRVEKSLDEKGVRFWRDIHHSTSGSLEKQIDRVISQNPTVLVVLSENSIKSDWVQHEVRLARELELETDRDVLCPVRLDDSFFTSSWPERVKEQVKEKNILDFSIWEDDEKFEKMFIRLIDGLNLFYKKEDET